MIIQVLDPYFLSLTLLVCVGWQLLFFAGASLTKRDTVTDFAYGTNFVAVAAITFALNQTFGARNILVLIFICLWGLRLALYLFARVIKEGRDKRFDGTRENCGKFALFWIAQMVTVWTISIPQTLMSSVPIAPPLGWQDGIGIALWVIGFLLETVSDFQKFYFKNQPETKDKMMMSGLWRYSRHVNYFGEAIMWWGIWSMSTATFFVNTVMYVSVLSPLYVCVILLFLSGVPTLETPWNKKYGKNPEFREYKASVPPFVPFFPPVYRICPSPLKLIFCCEFPFYNTGFPDDAEIQAPEASGDPIADGLSRGYQVSKGYQNV